MTSSKSFYEIMGVEKSASPEEIKKAFKKQALRCHPDKATDEADREVRNEKFKELNEAYSVLSDDNKKRQYDMYGTYDANMQTGSHPDLSEVFGDLFGGGGPGAFFNTHMGGGGGAANFKMFFDGMPHPQQQRGNNQDVIEIAVSMTEVYNGVNKNIQYDILDKCDACNGLGANNAHDIVKCVTCDGQGHVAQQMGPFMIQQVCPSCGGKGSVIKAGRECKVCNGKKVKYYNRSFSLKIPPGIPNKHVYKMDGKGSFDQNTETYNDIIIIFTHIVPKEFEVDYNTNNVTTEMDITLEELLCGFKKSIHIYDEHIDIHSDCYFDPSKLKRIPNKGFPQFKKKDSGGDLFVKFNIKYPSQEKALRKHHGDFVSIFKQK